MKKRSISITGLIIVIAVALMLSGAGYFFFTYQSTQQAPWRLPTFPFPPAQDDGGNTSCNWVPGYACSAGGGPQQFNCNLCEEDCGGEWSYCSSNGWCYRVDDPNNCGGCNNQNYVCESDEECRLGESGAYSCQCEQEGYIECADNCINPNTNNFNCGACGNYCSLGQCQGGGCTCPNPLWPALCNGNTCTNLQNDEGNCGSCGNYCSSNHICVSGECKPNQSGCVTQDPNDPNQFVPCDYETGAI